MCIPKTHTHADSPMRTAGDRSITHAALRMASMVRNPAMPNRAYKAKPWSHCTYATKYSMCAPLMPCFPGHTQVALSGTHPMGAGAGLGTVGAVLEDERGMFPRAASSSTSLSCRLGHG